MIEKLHNLKKIQTDQKLVYKAEIMSAISKYDNQIIELEENIRTSSVDRYGAISDFTVLEIHKQTLRLNVKKLKSQKSLLTSKIIKLDKEIVELQKESEKYAYILKEEKKEAYKKILKDEEEEASEFIQSKYIAV